jgi:hypothetical protein
MRLEHIVKKRQKMTRTLVPSFDHLANADLCNKRAVPNQCKNLLEGYEDCQRRIDIPVSAGIKLLSVAQCPDIMNFDGV